MIDYQLRYSHKAKYLTLRLTHKGLEVVIPARKKISIEKIKAFIQQKQSWIEKHTSLIQTTLNENILPKRIYLAALHQEWEVNYLPTHKKNITLVINPSRQITLMGNVQQKARCLIVLKRWLKQLATTFLTAQLTLLSQETQLAFSSLKIRNNSTRWGSCSSQGNISLCCKILFLPPHLMRHILIHELCHTLHMNHGSAFWQLFSQFDPQAEFHAKALKQHLHQIPWWVNE